MKKNMLLAFISLLALAWAPAKADKWEDYGNLDRFLSKPKSDGKIAPQVVPVPPDAEDSEIPFNFENTQNIFDNSGKTKRPKEAEVKGRYRAVAVVYSYNSQKSQGNCNPFGVRINGNERELILDSGATRGKKIQATGPDLYGIDAVPPSTPVKFDDRSILFSPTVSKEVSGEKVTVSYKYACRIAAQDLHTCGLASGDFLCKIDDVYSSSNTAGERTYFVAFRIERL